MRMYYYTVTNTRKIRVLKRALNGVYCYERWVNNNYPELTLESAISDDAYNTQLKKSRIAWVNWMIEQLKCS